MTDGQGNTVSFSETVIIFTSNIGMYKPDADGNPELNVDPDTMGYPEMAQRIQDAVKSFFQSINRPELLNRIGENIVVFDFIRDNHFKTILQRQIDKLVTRLETEMQVRLIVSKQTEEYLLQKAFGNKMNGARGIGNIIESHLLNPLSRYLYEYRRELSAGYTVEIAGIVEEKNRSISLSATHYLARSR